jgi:predicted lipid-binding transport protein (Tim44 family)
MKNWLVGALVVALVGTAVPTISDAKRLGGGRPSGMQRDMPARTAPDAPPPKPAAPSQQAAPATPAAPMAGAAPAAAAKRSWMGPIAGLAAGLGIAALISHLGMGEAFGNFLMLALLAVAGVALVAFLMRRFGNRRQAVPAGAAATGAARTQVAWPTATPAATPASVGGGSGAAAAPVAAEPSFTPEPAAQAQAATVARAFVPAAFDSEGFSRTAKMIFIRLQAANDTADLDDLRRFTTPELFASIRLEIQERGNAVQHTDVQEVHSEVLDVTNETDRQVVSVRFTGRVVEEKGAAPVDFREVWHLVKPHDDSRPWAIAGIEPLQ